MTLTVPALIARGSNITLGCSYDLEGDSLYSIKWYKGRREFYRFTPKENPAMKVFILERQIDVSKLIINFNIPTKILLTN